MAINAVRSTIANPNGSESSVDITRSDPTGQIYSGALLITNVPNANETGGFYILPLTSGTMTVQLSEQREGEYFPIQQAQIDAYLGQWMPMKVKRVISSTINYQIGW